MEHYSKGTILYKVEDPIRKKQYCYKTVKVNEAM